MPVFRESTYQIGFADEKAIHNLTTILGHLNFGKCYLYLVRWNLNFFSEGIKKYQRILKEYWASKRNSVQIKELPIIIDLIKKNCGSFEKIFSNSRFEITIRFPITTSLINVFPKFTPQEIASDPKFESSVKEISIFIKTLTNRVSDVPKICPPLGLSTKEDAWKALHLVYKKVPFLSAVDLPSQNCIMGLTKDGMAFTLSYGMKSTITEGPSIGFDLSEGFVGESSTSPIPQELRDAFQDWLENDKIGPVFTNQNIANPSENTLTNPSSHPHSPTNHLQNEADKNKNRSTHRHHYKGSFLFDFLVIILLLALCLHNFTPLKFGFTVLCSGSLLIRKILDVIGCKKAQELIQSKEELSQDETDSLDMGVASAKSNSAFLKAWGMKKTYSKPNYIAYLAGKHLGRNESNMISRIRRKVAAS